MLQIQQTLHTYDIKIKYDAWTILPLRTRNIYIMEAVSELGLTKLQLEQINACRLFLQITMLAEITDHTGCHILLQAVLQANQDQPDGLANISTSTLEWPEIGNPTKATWKLWMRTICNLFTGSDKGTKLHHPLGDWMETYQRHCFWQWHIAETGQLLYQKSPNTHPHAAIKVHTTRTYLTFSLTIPMNQSFQGTPVMPNDPQHCQIRLPISPMTQKLSSLHPPTPPSLHSSGNNWMHGNAHYSDPSANTSQPHASTNYVALKPR